MYSLRITKVIGETFKGILLRNKQEYLASGTFYFNGTTVVVDYLVIKDGDSKINLDPNLILNKEMVEYDFVGMMDHDLIFGKFDEFMEDMLNDLSKGRG